jgi:hypothetical protein
MSWDDLWDDLMSMIALVVLAILVAPVGTIMLWALVMVAVALKWPWWLYMILSTTMSVGVSWIAIRRLGPAVQGWTKMTLRKPWRP